MNTNTYAIGVVLTLLGGAGLAEVVTSDHGNFLICVIVFAVGYAMCIKEFIGGRK